jgi:altronate dehydratase small subunit
MPCQSRWLAKRTKRLTDSSEREGQQVFKTAIQIKDTDHVATLTEAVLAGETVRVTGVASGRTIVARADIAAGHKIAMANIANHTEIRKYGEVIGVSTAAIVRGDHVHVHNCRGLRGRRFESA